MDAKRDCATSLTKCAAKRSGDMEDTDPLGSAAVWRRMVEQINNQTLAALARLATRPRGYIPPVEAATETSTGSRNSNAGDRLKEGPRWPPSPR